jgi:hypothetical protein
MKEARGICRGLPFRALKNPGGFSTRRRKKLREPEILNEFPGGSLTEGIVSSISVRSDSVKPSPRACRRGRLESTARFVNSLKEIPRLFELHP